MKRALCLILILALLACPSSALAASAGSAGDPLISQSYMTGYTAELLQQGKALLSTAESAVKAYLDSKLPSVDGTAQAGYKSLRAAEGNTYTLPFGSSLILLSGSGSATCTGALLNTASGQELPSGSALSRSARYLVLEDSRAVFTITSASAQVLIEGPYTSGQADPSGFVDVPETHFAYKAIEHFVAHKYVSGVGDNRFDPSGQMTRGMFVTLLGRVYGVNTENYPGSSFTDVPTGRYYTPYVQWASRTGLVKGMGGGLFDPDRPITRQEMAKLVADFADYAGYTLGTGISITFADDAQIASWAKHDVYRAAWAGLITGREGNRFAPSETATRAEVCTLVYRLITA